MRDKSRGNRHEKRLSKNRVSIIGFSISFILICIALFLFVSSEIESNMASDNNINTSRVSSSIVKPLNETKDKNTVNINTKLQNTNENLTITNTVNSIISKNENESNAEFENTVKQDTNEKNIENTKQNEKSTKEKFIKPVEGEIYKHFSMDNLVYSDTLQEWTTHNGIDIRAEKNTSVNASKSGVVTAIKNDPRLGTSVIIEHENNFKTVYSCLDKTNISEGDTVAQGQKIGEVGNSGVFEVADGYHLHFELLKDEDYANPELYF